MNSTSNKSPRDKRLASILLIIAAQICMAAGGALFGGWLGASTAAALAPVVMTAALANAYSPSYSRPLYAILSVLAAIPTAMAVAFGYYVGGLFRGAHFNTDVASFTQQDLTVMGVFGAVFGILVAVTVLHYAFPPQAEEESPI